VSALEEGGNAVDAAVAASFALAVTLPAAGNLGGGGFLLYRDPGGRTWFLDHREVAPAAATRDLYLDEDGKPIPMASRVGWKAAGVPGTVVGLAEAHRRWGKLKWADLLAPAIQLAEEGFPVSEREHRGLSVAAKAFAADPFAAEVFLTEPAPPGGHPPPHRHRRGQGVQGGPCRGRHGGGFPGRRRNPLAGRFSGLPGGAPAGPIHGLEGDEDSRGWPSLERGNLFAPGPGPARGPLTA